MKFIIYSRHSEIFREHYRKRGVRLFIHAVNPRSRRICEKVLQECKQKIPSKLLAYKLKFFVFVGITNLLKGVIGCIDLVGHYVIKGARRR
jgi:hypothetical protein